MSRTCFLALLVTRFHSNTRIRPGRIDRAAVVCAEKRARTAAGDDDRFHFGPDFQNHLPHGFAAVVRIGINQPRLPKHVQIIRFNNRDSLTASAALVAFVGGHEGKLECNAVYLIVQTNAVFLDMPRFVMLFLQVMEGMNPMITVELIPDPEQGGFTARLPDLPAYGEGETEEAAIADLRDAVRGYIDTFGLDDALSRISNPVAVRQLDWDLTEMAHG